MSLLTVENLTIHHRGKPLVQHVSFTAKAGETLCLVGASGSGKTLTAQSIMGLLPTSMQVTADKLMFGKQNLLNLTESAWEDIRGAQIGMVFQEPLSSLNPVKSVGWQVAEVLQLHTKLNKKQRHERVIQLFEQVQLDNPEKRYTQYPHELSGGQRQRVMIAMTLAMKPKLLIADEPTTALDVAVQGEILRLIKSLQKEMGMAVLFITHDFGVVEAVADRVLVLEEGQLVESGSAKQIIKTPKAPYTKKLLAARPIIAPKGARSLPNNIILKADNIYKTYPASGLFGGKPHMALADVSFQLKAGEALGIVGESGCGKSTLARCITRLETINSGSLMFDDQDMAHAKGKQLKDLRKNLQMVFQDPFSSLNPRLTVGESIAEGMVAHGIGTRRTRQLQVEQLLTDVGLEPIMASRYPHEFSGGQRQRICIARALALEPKVLLADEATAALDVLIQKQILELLLNLRKKYNLALIFISHDLRLVSQLCDRVIVMQKGKIVENAATKQLFTTPKAKYTQFLLKNIP